MRQVNGQTAKEISEMLLEQTGKALMSNDFDLFAPCFHLPHAIETPDYKMLIKTKEELQATFQKVVDDYKLKQVTRLIRICEVAEFRNDNRVEATHITHLMSGDQRIADPFPSFSILEWIDDRWQGTSTQYAVDTDTTIGRALHIMANDD